MVQMGAGAGCKQLIHRGSGAGYKAPRQSSEAVLALPGQREGETLESSLLWWRPGERPAMGKTRAVVSNARA